MATRDRSGVSERTKQAILAAAATLIARDPNATMAEIASAAQTTRGTVHRHFPERADLVAALQEQARVEVDDAYQRARTTDGSARGQVLRLCEEFFERADLFIAAYVSLPQKDQIAAADAPDGALTALLEQGYRDLSIDTALPPVWIAQMLWGLIHASWRMYSRGICSRYDALRLLLVSFEKLLTPPGMTRR